MKENVTIDNDDKKWVKDIISKIVESISLLISIAGCILMVLQGIKRIEWPHGFIAGISCFGFGLAFFIVEKTSYLLNKLIDKRKDTN